MYYLHLFEDDATCLEEYESANYQEPWTSYSMDVALTRYDKGGEDYSLKYLTFDVISGGTIAWQAFGTGYAKTIQYSLNDGEWTSITASSTPPTITVADGDVVRFKGTNTTYAGSKNDYSGFGGSTAFVNIEGNIMSLLYGDNFVGNNLLTGTFTFCSLFKNLSAVSAEHLILPATTMVEYCYRAMFSYPDTASTGNTLIIPPALPATTLAKGCYWYMFEGTKITTAPVLPAPTLIRECYGNMFSGCRSLTRIKCMATNVEDAPVSALTNWVNTVSSSGTFIKDASATWPRGTSGIPNGWTVQDATRGRSVASEPPENG